MDHEKRRPPQADLPYEVRMKFIIHGYRKLQEKLDYIVPYTKRLEQKIERMQDKIAKQSVANKKLQESFVEANREKKRWRAHSEWLAERIEKLEGLLRKNGIIPPSGTE